MAAGDEQFVQNVNEDDVDRMMIRLAAGTVSGKARHYEKREAGRDGKGRVIYAIYLVWDE